MNLQLKVNLKNYCLELRGFEFVAKFVLVLKKDGQ